MIISPARAASSVSGRKASQAIGHLSSTWQHDSSLCQAAQIVTSAPSCGPAKRSPARYRSSPRRAPLSLSSVTLDDDCAVSRGRWSCDFRTTGHLVPPASVAATESWSHTMSRAARCQILARLTPHGMRHGHRTWMQEARIPQSRCRQAHQPSRAGRPEGDARGSPGEMSLRAPRGHWLTRFVPSMFRPSGARDQDRLPNSDTAAPGIGTNGPGPAGMTACRGADLRICVGLRGL
jgi:hypothetical protein